MSAEPADRNRASYDAIASEWDAARAARHPPFVDTMFGRDFFYDSYPPDEASELLRGVGFTILIGEYMNEPTGGRDKGRYAIVAEKA